MTSHSNQDEAPLFSFEDAHEPDGPVEDERGTRLEGVEIPTELLEHGNGRLPESMLVKLGLAGHRLHPSAADVFAKWRAAAQAAGINLTLTDSYRTLSQQEDLKKRKPTLSATPGRSVHGWGFAVDLAVDWPPKPFGNTVYEWLKSSGPTIGWHLGRPKDEPWHWVYRGPQSAVAGRTSAAQTAAGGQPELQLGAGGDAVKQLQQLLGITADGNFGPQTHAAVVAYQQANGLTPDGVVGPRTWAKLAPAQAAPGQAPPELRLGATGDHVTLVQARLGITADGNFGPQTQAAVVAFQQANGLTGDGVVGPQTWAKLTS